MFLSVWKNISFLRIFIYFNFFFLMWRMFKYSIEKKVIRKSILRLLKIFFYWWKILNTFFVVVQTSEFQRIIFFVALLLCNWSLQQVSVPDLKSPYDKYQMVTILWSIWATRARWVDSFQKIIRIKYGYFTILYRTFWY